MFGLNWRIKNQTYFFSGLIDVHLLPDFLNNKYQNVNILWFHIIHIASLL